MPGVPPNAFSKLKQAFKGLLKPKKRQDQQDPPQQQQDDHQHQGTAGASKPDVPPKLSLPPSQPLTADLHDDKQFADPYAGTGSAPVAGTASAVTEHPLKQAEDKAPVSPVAPTPISKDNAPESATVSSVSLDQEKPLPVPKSEIAADEAKPAAPVQSQPSTEVSQPATSENVKPNGTAPSTAAAAAADVQPAPKVSSESSRILDEKMPVMAEEPPAIKAKAAAPGMSATSGPLDDFPMEGDKP